MPLARRDCALAKVTVFLPHLDTCQRLRAALCARGLSAAADSVRRLQEAACEGLEVTAARCLGAFRPDADAATAHFGRRSRDVVCARQRGARGLASKLDGEYLKCVWCANRLKSVG